MARASIPQPVLPRGFRQLGAFEQGSGSSWQTLVARVEEEIASPAPTALPAGSRCVLKRRECAGIGVAEQLVRDVRPLSVLQHPHVVRYFGVALSPGATDVLLVCEFCARGSLLDLIYHHRRSTGEGGGAGLTSRHRAELLAPELVLEILVQLSAGLKYLHDEMSLAHGNLTAANVLLDGTGVVKLTDVGRSRSKGMLPTASSEGSAPPQRANEPGRGFFSFACSLGIEPSRRCVHMCATL